jgi:hypothetical protein
MKTRLLVVFASTLLTVTNGLHAQGTAFTYQGRLNDGTSPANGAYDLTFALFSVDSGAGQLGNTVTNNATAVSNGLFIVTLDFGASAFTGPARWLEIGVRTNGGGVFNTLAPRQQATPTPYAIYSETASASQLSGAIRTSNLGGSYNNALTFTNANNNFGGNGGGLTNVNAATLGGLSSSNFWKTAGNAGTVPGANFLGTADNQPLELKVNNQRGLRLEPTTNSPNVIGGSSGNQVDAGVYGATIAGGGTTNLSGLRATNRVSGNFGSIGGGLGNTVSGYSSVIGGGLTKHHRVERV